MPLKVRLAIMFPYRVHTITDQTKRQVWLDVRVADGTSVQGATVMSSRGRAAMLMPSGDRVPGSHLGARGQRTVIPAQKNRNTAIAVDGDVYALRNRIERSFNRLKNSRRLATRYNKTADSDLGFTHLFAVWLWIRHCFNRA